MAQAIREICVRLAVALLKRCGHPARLGWQRSKRPANLQVR
jgi:hypothetical protein